MSSRPAPFAWLQATGTPTGWSVARLPSHRAALAYPPGWHRIQSDPGTVTAALAGPKGLIVGYLNATPRQGNESLQTWPHFRPAHNADEGDHDVRVRASARGLHVGSGRASCVVDDYRTSSAAYREIACLVAGRRAQTVVVAAATTRAWPRLQADLRRAVATLAT